MLSDVCADLRFQLVWLLVCRSRGELDVRSTRAQWSELYGIACCTCQTNSLLRGKEDFDLRRLLGQAKEADLREDGIAACGVDDGVVVWRCCSVVCMRGSAREALSTFVCSQYVFIRAYIPYVYMDALAFQSLYQLCLVIYRCWGREDAETSKR